MVFPFNLLDSLAHTCSVWAGDPVFEFLGMCVVALVLAAILLRD
jgi:hypothetical protein